MDVLYFDSDEAMAAVATLRRFGVDVRGPFGRRIEAPGEPPYYEWLVTAYGMIGADYEGAERDEAEDYIDSRWDRAAEDRMIRDGYKDPDRYMP